MKLNTKFAILFFVTYLVSTLSTETLAAERTLSLVGIYSQSKVNFELETNSPYYAGKDSLADSSFSYGVLLETPLQGQWGLETGLIFLQRGYQFKNSSDSSNTVVRWKSLFVPITGRFHPTRNFTGSIGLYLDNSIGNVASYNSKNSGNIQYQPMKNYGYRQFDYGMTYSAGMLFSINSSTSFIVEIRFNESWSNLMDTNLSNVNKNEKATISETQVYLGFII